MSKKRVIQAGRSKEALVTVVDGSVTAVQPAAEKSNAYQEQQDLIRHSEILRTIDAAMKRWKSTICTPEYLTSHSPPDEAGEQEQWIWEYGIKYPLTNPPRIAPKKGILKRGSLSLGDNEVGIKLFDSGEDIFREFTFTAWGNEALRDPYTGEEIAQLEVKFQRNNVYEKQDFYAVSITEGYVEPGRKPWEMKYRNLEYSVEDLDTGNPNLNIQKSYDWQEVELLKEPHALALFNLMDILIPSCPPNIAQHNGRRTTSPAPRTRPPGR